MKMRKKLAALLAAAMIASVMPMTAFAASSNSITKAPTVAKDKTTEGNVPYLEVNYDGHNFTVGHEFYLTLEDAEFVTIGAIARAIGLTAPAKETDSLTLQDGSTVIRVEDKKELAVVIGSTQGTMRIPLVAKITGAAGIVTIDPNGTEVSTGKYTFATTNEAKSVVTIGDVPSFYTGTNKIAKVTIDESYAGAFANAGTDNQIELTLDNDDYKFVDTVDNPIKVNYRRGFASLSNGVSASISRTDDQKVILTVTPSVFESLQKGSIELELSVASTVRRPEVTDLNLDISGKLVADKEYKVATIADYGVELKSEKEYEFFAGREEKVEFHLNEIVDDSIVSGRDVEFSLPEGVYFKTNTINLGDTKITDYDTNDDNQITGFRTKLTTTGKVDKFKFAATLQITSDFEGDVVLTAEGRAIGAELETKLATVKPAVKVTVEPMTVKVGLKEQVGGKIVIEELDKGALIQNGEIVVTLEEEAGVYVTDADVEVTSGDLKKGDVTISKTTEGAITIAVKRKSKEASTIELTNIKVKLDRSVPEGAYEVNVGGSAISALAGNGTGIYGHDNITAKDFLFVGEKYTRAEVVFHIGSNKFLVNGKEVEMDAAAYIKDGRTMVPVRYLATALGIDTESIKFSAGVVTIFDDARVIQLQTGSKNLVINGMTIPMVAAAEIIEGRTYVPVTEIGSVFGVTGTWDAATQTATFK